MAYQDLYSDAALYFSLNNSSSYSTIGTNTAGSLTNGVFVADAPSGIGSTHSLRLNGYTAGSAPTQYSFTGFANQETDANIKGKTITFWYKQSTPSGGLVTGSTSLGAQLNLYSNTYTTQNDTTWINQGTYNKGIGTGTDRSFDFRVPEINTSTSAVSSATYRASGDKLDFDIWHHVAIVFREVDNQNLVEKAIYVDGCSIVYQFLTGRAMHLSHFTANSTTFNAFSTLNDAGATVGSKYMAHYAVWNRALSKEEIRQQAWYSHTDEDYTSLVLSDSPTYLAVFNNSNKSTDHTIYGATSWDVFDDSPAGISVNQTSFANQKGWLFPSTSTAVNNYTRTTDADMMNGLNTLLKSGEYSIEFWFKQSVKPSGNKDIVTTQMLSTDYQNGIFDYYITNTGQIQGYNSFMTGVGTVGALNLNAQILQIPLSTGGQNLLTLCAHEPGGNGWADGLWHHVVFSFSITDGWWTSNTYTLQLYIDGMPFGIRAGANTWGWITGTSPVSYLQLGNASSSTTLGDTSLAHLAFYPRRLTKREIYEHFVAGKDFIGRDVKYWNGSTWQSSIGQKVWNGSAWIDWTSSYWNGSSWVSF